VARLRAYVVSLAAALLAGAAATGAPACARAPACQTPRGAGAPGRPFLWEVSGGAGPLYLFGTLHIGGRDDVPALAWDKLRAAATFMTEVDDVPQVKLRESAELPRGKSLQSMLSASAWYDLRDALADLVDETRLNRMRPWSAIALLTRRAYPAPSPTMDTALRRAADEAGRRIAFLETWAQQSGVVDDAVDVKDLEQAIEDRDRMRCAMTSLMAAYRAGDEGTLTERMSGGKHDELVRDRNLRWIDELVPELDRPGGAFVVVGVSHLLGPDGLVDLLAARGYEVRRL
jgi:uncharacterized protein